MELKDKRVVLTGAASGIGAVLLKRLVRQGAQVIAADRQEIDLKSFKGKATAIHPFVCDLSQQQEVDKLFDYALETLAGIDVFIANAGYADYGTVGVPDWARIEQVFAVNVVSPLYSVAKMAQINPEQPYTVAITASAMAHMAIPGYAHYAATKAALHRYAEAYRYEMPQNGHLMLIYPIATRTQFFKQKQKSDAPLPRPSQTPDYVARRIIAGLKNDSERVNPSPGFRFFHLLTRLFPPIGEIYRLYGYQQLQKWRH